LRENPLQRRDALKLTAGALVAGAGSACAQSVPRAPATVADVAARLDPAAADAMLKKLDQRMDWIRRSASLPEDVLPLSKLPRGPGFDGALASDSALVRKSIRTLYLTGRFLDMPDEMKVHPGVQSRVRAMQTEMDDAVLGMTERLERMTPGDHRRLQDYLQRDPLFGERLAGVLEQTAKDDGLSFGRTLGVRSSVLELTRRMAAQSPGLVTGPLVDKVRRVEAHLRSDAEEARRMSARLGEQAFWTHQEHLAMLHDAWARRLGTATAIASTGDVAPAPNPASAHDADSAPAASPAAAASPGAAASTAAAASPAAAAPPAAPAPGTRTMKVGGIMMGFGAGSVALGLILAASGGGFSSSTALGLAGLVFAVTIGPILLVVGLITLLVGLAIYAAS
jgi:hypothetical protein